MSARLHETLCTMKYSTITYAVDPVVEAHAVGSLREAGHASDGGPAMLAHPAALALPVRADHHVSRAVNRERHSSWGSMWMLHYVIMSHCNFELTDDED